jgi:hypothetical protein
MADEVDLKKLPWAAWCEEALQWLAGQKVKCIALVTILDDGSPANNYYEATVNDQYIMGMSLIEDGIFRIMKANEKKEQEEKEGDDQQ